MNEEEASPRIPRVFFDCPHCRIQLVLNIPEIKNEEDEVVLIQQRELVCTRCAKAVYALYGFYAEAMSEDEVKKKGQLYRLTEATKKFISPVE